MPLITGCKLYVDETVRTVGYSLEGVRRLAVPYMDNRRAIKIEIQIKSLPTQCWVYDYGIKAWILQR